MHLSKWFLHDLQFLYFSTISCTFIYINGILQRFWAKIIIWHTICREKVLKMYSHHAWVSRAVTKKGKVYCTRYSQAVTHPSTNRAQCCLTSVIGREPVFSTWYGRRHLVGCRIHIIYWMWPDVVWYCIFAWTRDIGDTSFSTDLGVWARLGRIVFSSISLCIGIFDIVYWGSVWGTTATFVRVWGPE